MNTATQKPKSASNLTVRRPSANGLEKSLKDLQEDTTRFNLDLAKPLHKRLKKYAVDQDEDMAVLVRKWISEKLDEVGA